MKQLFEINWSGGEITTFLLRGLLQEYLSKFGSPNGLVSVRPVVPDVDGAKAEPGPMGYVYRASDTSLYLGMGLSKATGFVWAKRMSAAQKQTFVPHIKTDAMDSQVGTLIGPVAIKQSRVFVLLGDGEMSEGQNYEAMNFAAKHQMHEILAIVDCNGYSQDGPAMLSAERIRQLFRAAGWAAAIVADADGDELVPLIAAESKTPRALIVRTVKGKGVSFMEADPAKWHQGGPTTEEYDKARKELEK